MVEGAPLLREYGRNLIEGSNPSLSAKENAPVAQLDRVSGYEPGGRRFESFRARHFRFNIKFTSSFGVIMRRVVLYAISLVWTHFSLAYLPQDVEELNLTHACEYCDLTRSFIKIKPFAEDAASTLRIEKSYLINAKINGNDFIQSLIKSSNCMRLFIAYSHFQDSEFNELKLSYSAILNNVFKNQRFKNIDFSHAQINTNIIKFSEFTDMNFNSADLQNNQFQNNVFQSANFRNADLRQSNFSGSHFYQCNFEHAILDRCNFTNTNITQAQLNEADSYSCAILPDGSIYDNHGKETC